MKCNVNLLICNSFQPLGWKAWAKYISVIWSTLYHLYMQIFDLWDIFVVVSSNFPFVGSNPLSKAWQIPLMRRFQNIVCPNERSFWSLCFSSVLVTTDFLRGIFLALCQLCWLLTWSHTVYLKDSCAEQYETLVANSTLFGWLRLK